MQTRHRQRGVTLVESAIVTVVLAVLATTAAPGMQSLLETRRVDGVANQLATDIQFARSEAVARNAPVRLSIHAGTNASCYVIQTGLAAQCTCAAPGPASCTGGATQIKTVILPADQNVSLQANSASLLFDPLHGTATPTGTLRVLGTRGRAVHHIVNVMGRVRSCSPLNTVPGYRAC
ncbi:MAG: GspH/FimT family pseudopilin [Rhizobacter sp.]|nr:GspH/FimT family pseudopilin [Rhizobacter sp.]